VKGNIGFFWSYKKKKKCFDLVSIEPDGMRKLDHNGILIVHGAKVYVLNGKEYAMHS